MENSDIKLARKLVALAKELAAGSTPQRGAERFAKYVRKDSRPSVRDGAARFAKYIRKSGHNRLATGMVLLQVQMLSDPNTDVKYLVQAARDADPEVRAVVAKNPSLPVEEIKRLANDSDPKVADAAISNSSYPSGTTRTSSHKRRAGAGFSMLVFTMLSDPGTDVNYLIEAAKDANPEIRAAVAKNPSLPERELRKLAEDSDLKVSEAARRNLG